MKERVFWIEVLGIPLHCWNYTSFKRIVGVWGGLIFLDENSTMVKSFDKMLMLVSTKQLERTDELIYLEVGKVNFRLELLKQDCRNFLTNQAGVME